MKSEREIPERELRNNVGAILREVQAGARVRITVRGKPVAALVSIGSGRRFLPRRDVARILRTAPLDHGFSEDVGSFLAQTIEEL